MEGAALASRLQDGRRRYARDHQFMEALGGRFRFGAKLRSKLDCPAPFGFDVKDGPGRHRDRQHFFQAEGLGTELDVVVVPATPPAALILDGIGNFTAVRLLAKLDHIGLAGKLKALGLKQHAVHNADPRPGFRKGSVRALVSMDSFERERIIHPNLFDAMQGATPLAKKQIIEGAEGEKVLLGPALFCRCVHEVSVWLRLAD
jgi:hypothetical protein